MSWDKNGEYVADDPFKPQRDTFYMNVQQQIEAGEYFPCDPIAQEDYMFDGIANLQEQGVITGTEAVSIYSSWIAKRRPDTTIVHITDTPRGAFYE